MANPASPTIDVPGIFAGAETLLKIGPIGLAGLMLLLVIITLLLKDVNAQKQNLLKFFMIVGAFCFVLTTLAPFIPQPNPKVEHTLHMAIFPQGLTNTTLPPPVIKMNGVKLNEPFDYQVKSEVTAIIDATDAVDLTKAFKEWADQQSASLRSFAASSQQIVQELNRIPSLVTDSCPGGAHGTTPRSGPTVISIANNAANALSGFANISP